MPGTANDFRLYHSNALDVLAGLLAEELRRPAPGQSLLAPDIILIPQVAMRRWLQSTLAAVHGVAANLEFLTPGEFVSRALEANLGKVQDDLDAASLQWRLYGALTNPALRELPAMAQLCAYMGDDPLKPWTLAGELANVFNKYQAWRRDWLLRWEAGADANDPQAILWRAIAQGRAHRARRIQDYLARFEKDDMPLPAGLPPRLFAFATLNVSPDVLRVMATQSRVGTLHFYLPTPTKEYWGDLQALGARLKAGQDPWGGDDGEHPLLRDWGAAGKDFMALLGSYEVVHPSGEVAAYVDPEADGSRPRGLLQHMQADLYHRRGAPSGDPRPSVDGDDPSLQFHACHTRLRELQVLHDRLRALLEDPRFDPPLQPRQIAVLAPDIDPYVPYLDAVFGGHDQAAPIPYAMADASPLADEPLAEVFLRLLALPVSRFGLEEMLDLLASPPLAEAAQLEVADFDRLRDWLRAAGARWGLDAAHRRKRGAPADAAYTWQFALDRLLLGYATGCDELLGGGDAAVAPLPQLEGGALEALDALLRLLRVLARHERLLGEVATPAQWRERMLGLLDALLPRPPSSPNAQRALDRLRSLVDEFSKQAEKAGFAAEVPAEVVRAHFAAVLGQADTRAPLLTGGISFARMVPMRLLPFRVICLLGMNDGDFPRRDPAAGLNKLTAELGTEHRRHGDRSTREDDRYLFLQLFSSAQDVFYLSWLGADPRDGSLREPSALVTELLNAAAGYHADPEQAARSLVLRHPLQPFSPEAFGAGDGRRFSYRGQWQPAAGSLSAARRRLQAWFDVGTALPPPQVEAVLASTELRRFLLDPAGQFLRQRLQLRLPETAERDEDLEPLAAPGRGLERSQLQQAVFEALLAGQAGEALAKALLARGLLPSGPLGVRALGQVLAEVEPYATAFAPWRGDAVATSVPVEVDIDGTRLVARLDNVYPHGIARLRFGEPNGNSIIRNGLDWLVASAAGTGLPLQEFQQVEDDGVGPHPRPPLPVDAARAALAELLALRREGLGQPLVFAPYSGWELFKANDLATGVRKAAARWRGGEHQWAEGEADSLRLALRGRDPFDDAESLRQFIRNTHRIYGCLNSGEVQLPPSEGLDAFDLANEAGAEGAA